MSRIAAAAVVGLIALAALPGRAFAQDQAAPTDEEIADAMSFANNNAVLILYHEIGHLFVGELGLPVLGKNEDAADSLSAVFMLEEADEWSDEVLRDSAEGWYLSSARQEELTDWHFMGQHSLDKQRAFFFVCMMVGNNPEYYGELATEYGMDAAKQEHCGYEYRQAAQSWAQLLEPHEQDEDTPAVGQITVQYDDPGEYAAFAEALQADRFLEEAAEMINEGYVIPRDLTFRGTQCGEANAYYVPGNGEVKFCYEYSKDLYDTYLRSLADPEEDDEAEPGEADAQ
jgi:hypothetical protein